MFGLWPTTLRHTVSDCCSLPMCGNHCQSDILRSCFETEVSSKRWWPLHCAGVAILPATLLSSKKKNQPSRGEQKGPDELAWRTSSRKNLRTASLERFDKQPFAQHGLLYSDTSQACSRETVPCYFTHCSPWPSRLPSFPTFTAHGSIPSCPLVPPAKTKPPLSSGLCLCQSISE